MSTDFFNQSSRFSHRLVVHDFVGTVLDLRGLTIPRVIVLVFDHYERAMIPYDVAGEIMDENVIRPRFHVDLDNHTETNLRCSLRFAYCYVIRVFFCVNRFQIKFDVVPTVLF